MAIPAKLLPAPAEAPGISKVITGVSVPTVGAEALLYSLTYLCEALVFWIDHPYKTPVEALMLVALVVAADNILKIVVADEMVVVGLLGEMVTTKAAYPSVTGVFAGITLAAVLVVGSCTKLTLNSYYFINH
jgi:hypothetical protein